MKTNKFDFSKHQPLKKMFGDKEDIKLEALEALEDEELEDTEEQANDELKPISIEELEKQTIGQPTPISIEELEQQTFTKLNQNEESKQIPVQLTSQFDPAIID